MSENSPLAPTLAARLKRDAAGLVCAVIQDRSTRDDLMVGWMDDEALHRTLTDQHIWKLTVVRMLFIPVLTIAAFAALGLFRYGMVTQVIVLLECCPAASITSVFAVQFHHDEQFAAGSVVLTTLLSILFLPLCALIITMF